MNVNCVWIESPGLQCSECHFSSPLVFLFCFFPLCVFKVRVPEDAPPWKDIQQISAQDADTNSKLVYSIHRSLHPDSAKFFHLDPKSGVLVLTEQLDYEMIAVHTLIVMVTAQLLEYSRMEGICNVYWWHMINIRMSRPKYVSAVIIILNREKM